MKLIGTDPFARWRDALESRGRRVRGWWCLPDNTAAAAILYLHGGAYGVGSARAYQHFVGQVAARAKVAAFVPEYGLARSVLFQLR